MGSSVKLVCRLDEEEWELLQKEAEIRKLSENKVARILLLNALAGFDEKQQTFMWRFDFVNDQLSQLTELVSLAVASGALPLDADKHDQVELRNKLKMHFKTSQFLGKNILEMFKKGKL